MPRNGTGTYSLPQPAFVPGTTILSSGVNSDLTDIANTLTTSVSSDGQTPLTGTLKGLAGSASNPGYAFVGATTSGFFSAGGGNVGAAVNGVLAATLTSTGWSGGTIVNLPVGAISNYAGTSAPSQWLFCFGQAVNRTTYAALFAVTGITYGSGDGVTTFNLPDCRGRVLAGVDNMGGSAANRITGGGSGITGTSLGASGGQETHVLSSAEMPAHSHSVTDPSHAHTLTGGLQSFTNTSGAGGGVGGGQSVLAGGSLTVNSNTTGNTLANTGGGGTHQNTQPTIMFNTIIFAGV